MRNLLVFVGLCLAVPVPSVAAEEPDVRLAAAAREFFLQGLKFADKSDWSNAADRFGRAMEIRYSPVIAFNLAASLDELGKPVEASELLYRVESDAQADEALRRSARQLLAGVRPKLASLTVNVQTSRPGARAVLDGRALESVQLGAPFPADPGEHELLLVDRGKRIDRQLVTLTSGGSAEVSLGKLRVPTPEELAAQEHARQQGQATVRDGAPIAQRWWFWAGAGAAVVGVVTIVAVAALSGGADRPATAPGP